MPGMAVSASLGTGASADKRGMAEALGLRVTVTEDTARAE